MNHKEGFIATVERKEVDRPACWLGLPDPPANHIACAFDFAKKQKGSDYIDPDFPYEVVQKK